MNEYVIELLESHRYSLDCRIYEQKEHIESLYKTAAKAEQRLTELVEQRAAVAVALNG